MFIQITAQNHQVTINLKASQERRDTFFCDKMAQDSIFQLSIDKTFSSIDKISHDQIEAFSL